MYEHSIKSVFKRKLKKRKTRKEIDGIVRLALLLLVFSFYKLISFAFKSNYISKSTQSPFVGAQDLFLCVYYWG